MTESGNPGCAAIIDRLVKVRRSKGMTQQDLAKAARLTQSVIARLESKKVTPQLDTLLKVAAALDCGLELVPAEADASASTSMKTKAPFPM